MLSVIPALVFIRLVDRHEEWITLAGTEKVFLRRMLLTFVHAMNFVMKGRCISIEITSLRVV